MDVAPGAERQAVEEALRAIEDQLAGYRRDIYLLFAPSLLAVIPLLTLDVHPAAASLLFLMLLMLPWAYVLFRINAAVRSAVIRTGALRRRRAVVC